MKYIVMTDYNGIVMEIYDTLNEAKERCRWLEDCNYNFAIYVLNGTLVKYEN